MALENIPQALQLTSSFGYLKKAFPNQQSILRLQNHHLVTIDRPNGLIKIHRVLQDSTMTQLSKVQKYDAFSTAVHYFGMYFQVKLLRKRVDSTRLES